MRLIERVLEKLLGRLPIGWLQLTYSRSRFIAALAGVSFANVLVIVQLGISGSMSAATEAPYDFFTADILISAEDANSLMGGENVARTWLFQAMADPQIASGMPLYLSNLAWEGPNGEVVLRTTGVDPNAKGFLIREVETKFSSLVLLNSGIIDRNTRYVDPEELALVRPHSPMIFEASGETLTLYDTFSGGGGFGSDGSLFVSDQTFLNLFSNRQSGAPNHILLNVTSGADIDKVVERLTEAISDKSLRIRSFEAAKAFDVNYQNTQRPTGLIFGFGVVIGILVGIVIVYQVLSTDVASHLSEYATFKAMGYGHKFFLGVVFEEAMILAVFGFIPGVLVASALLGALDTMTGLPMGMTFETGIVVFFGTIIACAISGAIATRRLASADPAELF